MLITLQPIINNNIYNRSQLKNKNCFNTPCRLNELNQDTVSFSGKKDLLDLPAKKIIEICTEAINEKVILGQGKEAIAYKIDQYPEYCIRQEKRYRKQGPFKLSKALNKYDKVNHVIARLDEGTTLMKYIPGMPIKITSAIDPKKSVKKAIQELVSLEFSERSFKKVLAQIEEAKAKDIDFDRFGENLHVDTLNHEMTCIDFSPNIRDTDGEYNPISFVYMALDVDGTEHAERVFGKLCSAYAQRLAEVPISQLNFDKLDMNFYHRSFECDAFNKFTDIELLTETQNRLKQLIEYKKAGMSRKQLQEKINEFKDFVNKNLMPIKHTSYYSFY